MFINMKSAACFVVLVLSMASAMPFDQIAAGKPAYDDAFSRNLLWPLAAAAYDPDPQKCATTAIQGNVTKVVSIPCDLFKGDTCKGFVAVSESQKAIVLSFRGTAGTLQLVDEFLEAFQQKVAFNAGHVAKYFLTGFLDIWNNGMKDAVLTLFSKYPDYQVWVTGHSLGGSMGAIAADYIVTQYRIDPKRVKLITYGEPRTGDQAFADDHDLKIPYSFRVIHNRDLIPHLPFRELLNMDYEHHMTEIWYKNNMATADFMVCDQAQEQNTCSDGVLDVWEPDHHDYFNIHDRDAWTAKGCPKQ
ncbi:unnamed protein product, partial [Mesorhabditis spiculigera]